MNLLILSTADSAGGAAIATYRLHRGLRAMDIDSTLLVQAKGSSDDSVVCPNTMWQQILVILRPYLDRFLIRFYRQRKQISFSPAWLPERLAKKVTKLNPDIVHLFWVCDGFFRIETLTKFKRPIIWTLHDMWPFTGGCHYDDECGRFKQACGKCPVLGSDKEHDLSHRILVRKKTAWEGVPIVVVATSRWLAEMARASAVFKNLQIEVIPNGIDTEVYRPANKKEARAVYNLPQDKQLILFSAFNVSSDARKGGHLLVQALQTMSQSIWKERVELVIIGAVRPENMPDMGMQVHYMGTLRDEISQVLLYSAADVVVAPSMQENLSNTVMESLACGAPVVAFDIGGMPDMVDHQQNGYLARPFDSDDLATGIMWVLDNDDRRDALSHRAREIVVERYALQVVAHRYSVLYQSVLDQFRPV